MPVAAILQMPAATPEAIRLAISFLFNVLEKVSVWDKLVPATTEAECGNYRDHDLEGAKKYAKQWCDGINQKGWSAF